MSSWAPRFLPCHTQGSGLCREAHLVAHGSDLFVPPLLPVCLLGLAVLLFSWMGFLGRSGCGQSTGFRGRQSSAESRPITPWATLGNSLNLPSFTCKRRTIYPPRGAVARVRGGPGNQHHDQQGLTPLAPRLRPMLGSLRKSYTRRTHGRGKYEVPLRIWC